MPVAPKTVGGKGAAALKAPAAPRSVGDYAVDALLEKSGGGLAGGTSLGGTPDSAAGAKPLPQPVNQTSSSTANGGTASGGPQLSRSVGGSINISPGMGPGLVLVVLAVVAVFILWILLGAA